MPITGIAAAHTTDSSRAIVRGSLVADVVRDASKGAPPQETTAYAMTVAVETLTAYEVSVINGRPAHAVKHRQDTAVARLRGCARRWPVREEKEFAAVA
jgi:hypothetical protein